MADLYATHVGQTVQNLQDAGRGVYVWGFTPNGTHALIVDSDNDAASVCPVDSVASLGRWETRASLVSAAIYGERFPRRD